MARQYISYRRVSTKKQGRSGLGLEAQEDLIRGFLRYTGDADLVADYCEVYTGTELAKCRELQKAIAHAKRIGAVLIIAKTDRFRNTAEALQIYEAMGENNIVFCDVPHADKFSITLAFAFAEREALLISIRTKQALAAKKARGETWVRYTDTSAASQASARLSTDRRLDWIANAPLPKYCRARWEQGWTFGEILEDAGRMFDVAPEVYCTRNGAKLGKGQLSKWISQWRDMTGAADLTQKERKSNGV